MRYHDITKDDMRNGDGLRAVLWVSGCSHHCGQCQNPVTWDPEDGLIFDEAAEAELFDQLQKDYIAGVTFSGGDPLFPGNRQTIGELAARIRERFPDKTIWLYTGFLWEQIKDLPLMKDVDVCVDGRFVAAQKDSRLWWKGSRNQRVIDVKKTLASGEIVLYCGDFSREA